MKQDFANSNPETFLLEAPIDRRRQETFHGSWVRYLAGLLLLLASHISTYGQCSAVISSTGPTTLCPGGRPPALREEKVQLGKPTFLGRMYYFWSKREVGTKSWKRISGYNPYVKEFVDNTQLYKSTEYHIEIWGIGIMGIKEWWQCSSNVITFTVQSFTPGEITGNKEIDPRDDAGKITGTEGMVCASVAPRYHWERWVDGDNAWSRIPNETARDYSPGRLEKTTWFRRGRSTTSNDTKYTNNVKITVRRVLPGATFYSQCNYGGIHVGTLMVGRYTLADLEKKGLENDDIRSLKVPSGYEVQLYDHDNFTGRSIIKTVDDPCLQDDGFNDRASSIVVRGHPNAAVFYSQCNYGGPTIATLMAGRYTLKDLEKRGLKNDDIQSLRVPSGYEVQLYEHDDFIGHSIKKWRDDPCLKDDGFDNRTSSIVVREQTGVATFYDDCDYSGELGSLEVGRYTTADLAARGIKDNDIQSLKVNPGYEVVLWDDDNFSAFSILARANTRCLNAWFNNKTSSVIVRAATNGVDFYRYCAWGDYTGTLDIGSYTLSALKANGMLNKINSLKVPFGYEVQLYARDHFYGTSIIKIADDICLQNDGFENRTSSIIVRAAPVAPGSIRGPSAVICYNSDAGNITSVTAASGGLGSGAYTYNWEKSENGGYGWKNIAGATGLSYNPGPLTQTTKFRRAASRGGSSPAYTNEVRITVNSEIKAGAFGNDTMICYNSDAGEITSKTPASGAVDSTVFYRMCDNRLVWGTLGLGRYTLSDLEKKGLRNNDIQSLKIPIGYEVVLYEGGNFDGDSIMKSGDVPCLLADEFIDKTSSIIIRSSSYNWQKWEEGATAWTDIPDAKAASYRPPDSLKITTYFRRGISSGNCGPVYNDNTGVKITVLPELKLQPGEIGGDTTICYGNKAGEITNVTAASGAPDSALIYNWQKWEQGDTVWTDIPAAKDSSYQPPDSLTKTTYFRRGVSSGNCGQVYKDNTGVKITVLPELKPGEIGSDTTICYGSKAGEITNVTAASGMPDSTLTYNWQKWEQGDSVWTDIPAAKDSSYSPPDSLTKTTYFRRGASSGNCGPVYKDNTGVKITVLPELKPGEIGGDTTICYGSKAGEITNVAPASGMPDSTLTYNWQKWEQGDTVWTDIPAAKDSSYSPPDSLKITTYFRRGVSSGNCGPVYKDDTGVKITVVAELKPGEIGSDTTICYGSKAGEITNVTAASGMPDSALTYNWQKWEQGDSVWTDIPAAKDSSYSPPDSLKITTYFRRGVSSGNCGPVYKDDTGVKITVVAELKPGEIGSDTTICYGSKAGEITNVTAASGMPDSTLTYNWQKWEQGDSVWTDIPAAKDTSYSPPDSLKITTYFRRGVSSGNCGPVYKDDTGVKITVFPELKPGEIGEDRSIPEHSYAGTIKNLIAASGGPDSTNLIYNWQKKEEGDTVWTDIPDEKEEKYLPREELIKTTSYRRGVTSGNCGPVYKDDIGVKVTVTPTRRKDPPGQ